MGEGFVKQMSFKSGVKRSDERVIDVRVKTGTVMGLTLNVNPLTPTVAIWVQL